MAENGVKVALHRMEAIILKGKTKRDHVYFRARCTTIKPAKTILYLGITIDQGLAFDEHIKKVINKIRTSVLV